MTNRKNPVIILSTDKSKRSISRGDQSAASLPENPLTQDDLESDATKPLSYTGSHENPEIIEQRKARRFQVCSLATIRWLGCDGVVQEAAGMVRDISTCGIFVEASVPLRTNVNVELEIAPFGLCSESPKTELHFEGKIIRKDQRAQRPGFAVAGFLWLAKLELSGCLSE